MKRRPKVQFYRDEKKEWRWRLKGGNGEVFANSAGEGYTRKADAKRAWQDVVNAVVHIAGL